MVWAMLAAVMPYEESPVFGLTITGNFTPTS